jgi:hypothetical protein
VAEKKHEVSSDFLAKVEREMPEPGAGPEAQLDYLLPLYRGIQSEGFAAELKLGFLSEIIIPTMQEIERKGSEAEYIASSKRTMGMLVYSPNTIGGEGAQIRAKRIRRTVAKVLGEKTAKNVVEVRRTVSYKVKWPVVKTGGADLLASVRKITGMKSKPALDVGPVTKRARRGKPRKGRH